MCNFESRRPLERKEQMYDEHTNKAKGSNLFGTTVLLTEIQNKRKHKSTMETVQEQSTVWVCILFVKMFKKK